MANIVSFRPLLLGEYVYMEYYGYRSLAFVESTVTGSMILSENILDPRDVERLVKVVRGHERVYYYRGRVRIVGNLDHNGRVSIPPVPPPPGTEVFRAPPTILRRIFSPAEDGWVKVGTLLREPTVEVRVNVNKIVSKHLGILAMTGMGKSNLVALLSKRIGELGGTVIIFDYHGEYTNMFFRNVHVNVITPQINPYKLEFDELARLLGLRPNATRQRMVLLECFENLKNGDDKKYGMSFFDKLRNCIQGKALRVGEPAQKVLESLITYSRLLCKIIDEKVEDVLERIELGAINVVDLSELRASQADAVVAHWLQRVLEERKLALWSRYSSGSLVKLPIPVVVVLEEAHVFIPIDEDTATKKTAEHIAREGRKFGVGMIVVSQRPRGLDPNILSQMGSLAVLRIAHPEDRYYIAKHCEAVTQELVEELSALNVGEALLLGEWVRIPTVAKVDYVPEKRVGIDLDAVAEWRASKVYKKLSRMTNNQAL